MSQSYVSNLVHIVFSTIERRQLIRETDQARLWAYIAGIGRNHDMTVITVGGVLDHIHVLTHIPPIFSIAKAVSVLKANSSRWMNERGKSFAWQKGYGAFSVSVSNLERVKNYIDTQVEHHRRRSFEQEFIALLKKHKVPYEPARIFD
ncbi:MAG: IS200/IS605 family transposase [Acidobacteriales bacterium]|nr:IS200/IS605 family transposase [Terriglobales bacterium]